MTKLTTLLASLLLTTPVMAAPETTTTTPVSTFRPFRYETPCLLETKEGPGIPGTCVVIETREKGGALRTRNIFSNTHRLTIKGRFVPEKGYMTWDSHNKFEYKWEYKVGGNQELGAWTYVMPGFLLQNISWD